MAQNSNFHPLLLSARFHQFFQPGSKAFSTFGRNEKLGLVGKNWKVTDREML